MIHILPVAAFLLYLASSIFFLISLLRSSSRTTLMLAKLFVGAGFVIHTLSVVPLYQASESYVEALATNYFYFLAWGVAATYILFRKKFMYPIVGVMITAAVALFMLSSSYLVHVVTLPPGSSLSKTLVGVHVFPAIAAEVCLVLCLIVSLVYLLQERRLKTRSSIDFVLKGPSLTNLTTLQLNFLLVGFVCMSTAILTGCVWAWSENKSLLSLDLLQWVAFATWGLLGYLLHLRLSLGWSPKRVSQISLYAGGLAVLAFLIVRVVSLAGGHGA